MLGEYPVDNSKMRNTICQSLDLVPFEKLSSLEIHRLDRGIKKLRTVPMCKAFIAGQLRNWNSYIGMEEGLRADKSLLAELEIESISASQLSRRIAMLPTELLAELFTHTVANVQALCKNLKGVTVHIGKLNIIDSTSFTLPMNLCKWARVKKDWTGVKAHVRLVVEGEGISYPDAVIPSTGNVFDTEGAHILVVIDPDATYVLDRGYIDYRKMDSWVLSRIDFVLRLTKRNKAQIIEMLPIAEGSNITLDARVKLGSKFRWMEQEVRLVEFIDEKGRKYRVVTTRWDLSAEEIAEIYKSRWLIELFFKWLKQHLPATKIHSTNPQGIWNEIFLAMIAYLLSLYIKLSLRTTKSQWRVLELIRHYAGQSWKEFTEALWRKPSRSSKGRQKTQGPPKPIELSSNVAIVK
jgi:hypothetical protein